MYVVIASILNPYTSADIIGKAKHAAVTLDNWDAQHSAKVKGHLV